jgi:hypothetical protein
VGKLRTLGSFSLIASGAADAAGTGARIKAQSLTLESAATDRGPKQSPVLLAPFGLYRSLPWFKRISVRQEPAE